MSVPTTIRDSPKTLRQVGFGVATFSMQILSDTSFKLQPIGFLGGQVPGRQMVPRAITHRSEQGPNWGLVVDPFPFDRRAQWLHRCHQDQVTFGGRWPNSYRANKDRLSPHACKLFGRRSGRGCGETFVTRHVSGTQSRKRRSASESVWPHVWRLCKRTSWLNTLKQAISTNLTLCWKWRKDALGQLSGGWWMVICPFVITRG